MEIPKSVDDGGASDLRTDNLSDSALLTLLDEYERDPDFGTEKSTQKSGKNATDQEKETRKSPKLSIMARRRKALERNSTSDQNSASSSAKSSPIHSKNGQVVAGDSTDSSRGRGIGAFGNVESESRSVSCLETPPNVDSTLSSAISASEEDPLMETISIKEIRRNRKNKELRAMEIRQRMDRLQYSTASSFSDVSFSTAQDSGRQIGNDDLDHMLLVNEPAASRKVNLARKVEDARFDEELVSVLTMAGISWTSVLQRGMWPAVNRRKSVVAVGRDEFHLGFIVPLINQILVNDDLYLKRPKQDPAAVVLCPTWKAVNDVTKYFQVLMSGINKRKLVALAVYEREKEFACELMHGCDVLVTTPKSLVRLLAKRDGDYTLSSLKRCAHLVLTDADLTFEHADREVAVIVEAFRSNTKSKLSQIILTSKSWTKSVEIFIEKFLTSDESRFGPSILVSDWLEAMIFGRLQVEPLHCPDKLGFIKEKVASNGGEMVIMCSRFDVGRRIVDFLGDESEETVIFAHENLDSVESIGRKVEKWKKCPGRALILTDPADRLLSRSLDEKCRLLIHFDIPPKSKRLFAERHVHLKRSMRHFYANNPNNRDAKIVFLIGEEEKFALKSVLMFLNSVPECRVESGILNLYLERIKEQAENKKCEKICPQILTSGKCEKLRNCEKRHFFVGKTEEEEISVPVKGQDFYFRVTQVLDPNRYLVRIEQVLNFERKRKRFVKKMTQLNVALSNLDESGLTLALYEDFRSDKLFLYKVVESGCFKRIRILDCRRHKETGKVASIHVLFVDEGRTEPELEPKVFLLPETLGETIFPKHAQELILCSVKPKDDDLDWSEGSAMFAQEKLLKKSRNEEEERLLGGRLCVAKSVLGIGNTVWVKRFEFIRDDEENVDFGKLLLKKGFSDENPEHLVKLKALLKKADLEDQFIEDAISRPKVPTPVKKKKPRSKSQPKPSQEFAFLDHFPSDTEFFGQNVEINHFDDVHRFYVRNLKYDQQFGDLKHDLREIYDDDLSEEKVELVLNDIYICAVKDDRDPDLVGHHRAKLIEINNPENLVVFFLDLGFAGKTHINDLAEIPDRLITKLPFQAIQCELYNVASVDHAAANDFIFGLIEEDPVFPVTSVVKIDDEDALGGRRFSVNILYHYDDDVSLADELVNRGFALYGNEDEADFMKRFAEEVESVDEGEVEVSVPEPKQAVQPAKEAEPAEVTAVSNAILPPRVELKVSFRVSERFVTERKVPKIVWKQNPDHRTVILRVEFEGLRFDMRTDFLHVKLEPNSLFFHYLDVVSEDDFVLYQIPTLALFYTVVPDQSGISANPKGFTLKMKTARKAAWRKLTPIKHGFIKRDHEDLDLSDDDDEGEDPKIVETLDRLLSHSPQILGKERRKTPRPKGIAVGGPDVDTDSESDDSDEDLDEDGAEKKRYDSSTSDEEKQRDKAKFYTAKFVDPNCVDEVGG